MIRHIVTWKLKDRDDAAKANAIAEITAALEPLVGVIPGLVALKIHGNIVQNDVNWDLGLISDFDSVEALDGYQVHPAHVEAAAVPRSHAAERATFDFEL